jgi:hypothetical protein
MTVEPEERLVVVLAWCVGKHPSASSGMDQLAIFINSALPKSTDDACIAVLAPSFLVKAS